MKPGRVTRTYEGAVAEAARILAAALLRIEAEQFMHLDEVARRRVGEPPFDTFDAWWNELYMRRLEEFDFLEPSTPRQRRQAAIYGL